MRSGAAEPLSTESPGSGMGGPPPVVGAGHFVPRRHELRELAALAAPVALAQVGLMMQGVVDSIMVGRVSPADLAAVALGNVYFFAAVVFGMGVLFALDPVVSQALGADDHEGVARGAQRGVLLALGLTVVASLLLLPVEPILAGLGQPAEVVPVAAGYARASIAGVLPFYLYIVQRQVLQAMGRLGPVLAAMLVANLANVLFNWVLVFGNLGAPALGAVGSGWASSASRLVMAVSLSLFAWPGLRDYFLPIRPGMLRWAPLTRMLRIGAPTGVQLQLEFGAFAAAGLAMGLLGTIAVAGHQVALNLASLTFMVPVGVAQAAAVLVGRAVGREDPWAARRAAGAGILVGAGFMTLTALAFLTIPGPLSRMYSPDPAVIALGASLLPIAGLFQVADGIQVVAAAALRGIGDTRVPMLVNLFGFWGVGLPFGLVLAFRAGVGPQGVWWGLAVGLVVVAVLLLRRVRVRFGRDLRRLVLDAH